ncbi:MAG: DUF255 domain-containing protein [Thermoanaerobaculia bacterium]
MTTAAHHSNRLASESSPYLKQHANNPVDWYPWGPEAFDKARREGKPIFLSIGYSACHWCHVMAHESFENESVAQLLNENFVAIKVDREERPDVDDVYMTAVQLTTGHGGWPLSAFLLPDGKPFFAGTYFPPEDRHGRAGFKTLLQRLVDAYRDRLPELEESALQLAQEIARSGRVAETKPPIPLAPSLLQGLTAALKRAFDPVNGGFGGAPKFPPHMALDWLLQEGEQGDTEALGLATRTLDAMALGGIHDHLGGGFHRYSTDERWLVPHFEKMLSDNAQLLGLYARAFAITGRALYERTARATGDYLLREMRGAEGAFYAATDADSEGKEGKFFVWSAAELEDVLGKDDAAYLGRIYQVSPSGNFRDEATQRATGVNILHLRSELTADEEARVAPLRAQLLAHRQERVPPGLDDKRISGWNALAISGLATASRDLHEPGYLEAAQTAARFLFTVMRDGEGRLLRTWKDGDGKIPGFLEDEAFFAHALLDLAEVEPGELGEQAARRAHEAVDRIRRRFRRPGEAGFTFSGEGNEELLARGRDLFDKAIPSGSGSAARALMRVARLTGDAELAGEARAALEEVSWLLDRSPHGTESWSLTLKELLAFESEHGPVKRVSGAEAAGLSGKTRELPSAVPAAPLSQAEAGPIRAEAFASVPRAGAGERIEVTLRILVKDGYHLPAADGLAVEALAGKGLLLDEVRLPAPERVMENGLDELQYRGTVVCVMAVSPSRPPIPGEWLIALSIRTKACGEGVCLPERALALSIPIVIGN